MNNIFGILPDNFFNIFSGSNRRILADCLFLLYKQTNYDIAYSINKDQVIATLNDYFNSHIISIEDDLGTDSNEQALQVINRLKECGWINEELGANYSKIISFEDYTITIIESLINLNKESEIEYSGYIYTIFQLLEHFDINNGDHIIEQAYVNTKLLFSRLKTLNSNIKKYIQKLMDDEYKDNLEALLNLLLDDYQNKIVDRAYHNLTTKDHPSKYKNKIITNLELVYDNENYTKTIITKIQDKKDYDYDRANTLFNEQINYMLECFSNIDELLDEIDHKNNKYIESAISRINFLIDVNKDVEGKINKLIKALVNEEINSDFIKLNSIENIDQESLSKPRINNIVIDSIIENSIIDFKEIDSKLANYFKESYASKKAINDYVTMLLKDNNELKASSLKQDNYEDVIRIILIFLYGYSNNINYHIKNNNENITSKILTYQDFTIVKGVKNG